MKEGQRRRKTNKVNETCGSNWRGGKSKQTTGQDIWDGYSEEKRRIRRSRVDHEHLLLVCTFTHAIVVVIAVIFDATVIFIHCFFCARYFLLLGVVIGQRVCVVVTWGAPQENHSHKWACLHPLRESWWDVNCPDDDSSWSHEHCDAESLRRLPVQTEILTLQSNLCICYVGLHPSRLSRAGRHRGSRAQAQPEEEEAAGKHVVMRNELQPVISVLPPQLRISSHNEFVVTKKKCTFTIHTADRFGVRFRDATLHWVVHARKAKHLRAHFSGISHAIILVWRKVKNIKNESCGGMCCRQTLLCHYHAWQLFRGEAFFFLNVKKNFD